MTSPNLPPSNLPQNPVAILVATYWPDSYFYTPWSPSLCDDFGNHIGQHFSSNNWKLYVQWLFSTATYGGDPGNHLPSELDI